MLHCQVISSVREKKGTKMSIGQLLIVLLPPRVEKCHMIIASNYFFSVVKEVGPSKMDVSKMGINDTQNEDQIHNPLIIDQ